MPSPPAFLDDEFEVRIPGSLGPTPNVRMKPIMLWAGRKKAEWQAIRAIARKVGVDVGRWPLVGTQPSKARPKEAIRQHEQDALAAVRRAVEEVWPAPAFAEVAVMFVVPDHRDRDYDNAISGSKPFTDALVRCGVLQGDGVRHIGRLGYGFKTMPGLRFTVYRVRAFRTEYDESSS